MSNYYRILGIRKDASDAEIKEAYKKIALSHNPKRRKPRPALTPSEYQEEQIIRERNEELESLQIFMLASEAYDVLSDPLRKSIYDQLGERALKEGLAGPDGFIPPYAYHGDPFRTFKDFFGTDNPFAELQTLGSCSSKGSNQGSGMQSKDPPIQKTLPITLEEAYNGSLKKILITKKILNENGKLESIDKVLTVQIPPGSKDKMQFVFPSEGDQSMKGQPADIIFTIEIEKHAVYEREGDNLVKSVNTNVIEALLGGTIPVQTLDGRFFKVYMTHMEEGKVIKGEGMPILGDLAGRKGDLIIRFNVSFAGRLTHDQRMSLRQSLQSPRTKKCVC